MARFKRPSTLSCIVSRFSIRITVFAVLHSGHSSFGNLLLQRKRAFCSSVPAGKAQPPDAIISPFPTHPGQRLATPLSHALGHADDTLHGLVQRLLYVLQGRGHGDVGNGQGEACPEKGPTARLPLRCTATV